MTTMQPMLDKLHFFLPQVAIVVGMTTLKYLLQDHVATMRDVLGRTMYVLHFRSYPLLRLKLWLLHWQSQIYVPMWRYWLLHWLLHWVLVLRHWWLDSC